MITDTMKSLVATYIQGTLINNGKIGLGGNSTYSTQTGLDVDLGTTVTMVATKSDENVIEVHLVQLSEKRVFLILAVIYCLDITLMESAQSPLMKLLSFFSSWR